MRVTSMAVSDAPPVRRFDVSGLADVVVIAGPNGVGKTRLMQRIVQVLRGDGSSPAASIVVEATSPSEEEAWGRRVLNLSDGTDLGLYRATVQTNRRRRNWRSSVLQFESDRSIQNVQALQFSWDMPDPLEEDLSWDMGFSFWKTRWQDTVHAMFRMIEHQKQSIGNQAIRLRREGHDRMNLQFSDPMTPFKQVFAQLLAPKELVDPAAREQVLRYRIGEDTFDLSTLSSGEREVVNIAFDFLLRRPADCVVFFDEPELHLHPELSHRLIRTLEGIGERNQLFLTTHSPDIIAGSLDKSVIFVSPPTDDSDTGAPANQAIPVSEDDETNQALRLLGHSIGIITLGRKIVLIEGTSSSVDKETYGSLLQGRYPGLVLVPSGGKHVIESFDAVHKAVLSKSLWGVEFFMLCDRDSAPVVSNLDDRVRVLGRYHLENYFMDETVWAQALAPLENPSSWLRDPIQIRESLRTIAREYVSYATALAVSSALRLRVGNVDTMLKGAHEMSLEDVISHLQSSAATEEIRVRSALAPREIEQMARVYGKKLESSLDADDDGWKAEVPGKPVLANFARRAQLHVSRARKLYLDASRDLQPGPFHEVLAIFESFATR